MTRPKDIQYSIKIYIVNSRYNIKYVFKILGIFIVFFPKHVYKKYKHDAITQYCHSTSRLVNTDITFS